MPVEKISHEESLFEGTEKLNASIEQSNDAIKEATTAKSTANQAVSTSQEAVTKAESVQAQFNAVVVEGDSSPAADQARLDAENVLHPTLKARADSDYNKVTAQLAEKANQSEVRLRTEQIGLNDATPELVAAIEGGAGTSFNLLSVPRNGTVTHEKTNFLKIGKNMFNKNAITVGYRVDPNNGDIIPEIPEYPVSVSEFIPVSPNTQYAMRNGGEVAFYDENRVYISGLSRTTGFTTPTNVYYVRHNTDGQSIETQQLEKGATFTNYEPYEEYSDTIRIKKQNVKGKLIDKDNLTFQAAELTLGKNLFNKSTATDGKYVDANSGNLSNEIAPYYYWASDYIDVTPGETYSIPSNQQIAWYDESKVYISGSSNLKTFAAPANARYIRISVPESAIDTFQLEQGSASTSYETFGYKIDNLILENTEKSGVYLNQQSLILITNTGSYQFAWKRLLKNYNPNTMRVSVIAAPSGSKFKENYIELNNVGSGAKTLTIKIEYLNGEEIATQQLTVQSSDKTTKTTQQYLLMIGDSITRELGFTGTVSTELTNVTPVGIRSLNDDGLEVNEGRGGWKLSRYATEFIETGTAENPFMFPNGVAGNMYFGNTDSWKKICYGDPNGYEYKGFQLIARDWVVGGVFQYDSNGYRINPPTGAVMYDPTKASGQKYQQYDGAVWTTMNPQPSGVSFDFGKYVERFKVAFSNGAKNPTIISIMLGTNDLQNIRKANSSTMVTLRNQLSTMLTSIKAWNPNVKIILCVPPLSSTQDRWGDARGVDMTKWEFDDNIHLFAEELFKNSSQYPMPYTVCNMIGALWDEQNDHSDWLHPTTQGKTKLGKWLAGSVQYIRP